MASHRLKMDTVKNQYELYPYPARDPEDEKKRLYALAIDHLGLINHYCFKGLHTFSDRFRALVAGGGTGDSAIYLAEQLRETDAEVVYLDLSAASMEIAKARASIRKLKNIRWVQGSIMDLKRLDLGKFDYITSLGVLHHLDNPIQGLANLTACLNEDGGMGLMVYGAYGRTGVYQMQALMKLINGKEDDPEVKIKNTVKVLADLPPTHWFKRGESLFSDHKKGKAGIYDLFLHSVDKPFTVLEIYDWVERAGLHISDFCPNKTMYWPETIIKDDLLLNAIKLKPKKVQQAVAELLRGDITKHEFYVSKNPRAKADIGNRDLIPYFLHDPQQIKQLFERSVGHHLEITMNTGGRYDLNVTDAIRSIVAQIDGRKTLRELVHEDLQDEFRPVYEALNAFNYLFLRGTSV